MALSRAWELPRFPNRLLSFLIESCPWTPSSPGTQIHPLPPSPPLPLSIFLTGRWTGQFPATNPQVPPWGPLNQGEGSWCMNAATRRPERPAPGWHSRPSPHFPRLLESPAKENTSDQTLPRALLPETPKPRCHSRSWDFISLLFKIRGFWRLAPGTVLQEGDLGASESQLRALHLSRQHHDLVNLGVCYVVGQENTPRTSPPRLSQAGVHGRSPFQDSCCDWFWKESQCPGLTCSGREVA